MIRPLRQRHRVILFGLSAFLPALFVMGIVSRKPVPVLPSLPSALARQVVPVRESLWVREDLWEKGPMRTRLLTEPNHSSLAVEIVAREPIVRPDMLVYWVPGAAALGDSLPNDAVFLGAWMQPPASALALPVAAKASQGKLILYSLADHEIVNVSKSFFAK